MDALRRVRAAVNDPIPATTERGPPHKNPAAIGLPKLELVDSG